MTGLTILEHPIRTQDNFYSLNDLHRSAGGRPKHQPNRFLRLDSTSALIHEINQYPDLGIDQCSDVSLAFKTKHGGTNSGTWVCKELVYAYAMWISAKFHLQIIRAFDQIQKQSIESHNTMDGPVNAVLTIENGQIISAQSMPGQSFVTSPENLSTQLRELGRLFTDKQLQDIACEALNGIRARQ